MSDVSSARLLSSAFAAAGGLVVPSPRVIGELGGIEAYGARKLQTAHGASMGAMSGQIAAIPLTIMALKKGKLKWRNINSLKKAAIQYVKRVGVPTAIGAGGGAYWWHGGDNPEAGTKLAIEELREQLRLSDAVRDAIKEKQVKTASLVKTSALPQLIKVLKKTKDQGIPVDPNQEVRLKSLHKALRKSDA